MAHRIVIVIIISLQITAAPGAGPNKKEDKSTRTTAVLRWKPLPAGIDGADALTHRMRQVDVIKKRPFLIKVLSRPEIVRLKLHKDQKSSLAWLDKALKVELANDDRTLSISLPGHGRAQALLVNASAEACLEKMAEERKVNKKHFDQVKAAPAILQMRLERMERMAKKIADGMAKADSAANLANLQKQLEHVRKHMEISVKSAERDAAKTKKMLERFKTYSLPTLRKAEVSQ